MQTVFPVKFPPEYDFDVETLATRLSRRTGIAARGCPVLRGTNSASIAFENGAFVELVIFDRGEIGVAYNGEPSYFEWATLAELQALGGDLGGEAVPEEIAMTWSAYDESRSRRRRWWKLW